MTRPTLHQLDIAPAYIKRYILELESRIEHLELTLPWHESGMDWFTLFSQPHEPIRLFTCDENGTHPIFSLGPNDRLFIGRTAT